ncbi:uncharacterized protein LOC132560173 [Ylistrum balloti]|uniref:uncharacterized protein LOC132560173 n=1 Tax=Ylistrum balloti TaxID=509963 RepID=UPI0029057DE2|nr:uncharacterized protein LOC132560173 [Ylistrum balloti]
MSYDSDDDRVFVEFPKSLVNALNIGLDSLMDETNWMGYISLTPLKILNSNAADCHEGFPFSKAYCCTEKYSTQYSFGSVFRKGISMLIEFMLHRTVPDNKQEKFVLSKLLHYLFDYLDTDAEIMKNMEMYTETELTAVIANHLFGKLSTSSCFTIDKQCKGKGRGQGGRGSKKTSPLCPCEKNDCVLSGDFGDTSIGNWMVWHGNVNVIINNEVVIGSQDVEEKDCSPGGKSPVEVKLKSNSLSRNPQVIAQNIVFSFLQKHRHPESENFLFPCIGVTGKDMIVYFYDSMHDVLLESTLIPLHGMIPSAVSNINLVAIVVSWLVVNYKYLCDGVMEEMKTMKAEFFSQAEAKLAVYKFDLKAGEVGNSCPVDDSQDKVKNVHHPFLMDLKKRKRMVVLDPSER